MTPRKRTGDAPQEYDVLLAMASFMSLRVDDAGRADLERLSAHLEGLSGS